MARVVAAELDEGTAIEVLRSPFCTVEIAERVASSPRITAAHRVRELLCTIRGMPASRLHDLVATLPWGSLLRLAQAANVPPMVRRLAERRLILRLGKLTLGEKTALARRSHRALFKHLARDGGDDKVYLALLENPRMTEDDVVGLVNSIAPSPDVILAIIRSSRWSRRRAVRMAVARCPTTPLPLAFSAVAELGPGELRQLVADAKVPVAVREGAGRLLERRCGQTC